MFITDHFIYIHLQKTAGTRIREILAQVTDGQSVGRSHGSLLTKPKGKLVFGSIRNPLDWYVSLWAFGCAGKGGVLSWLKDDPEWQAVYADSNGPELFHQWLEMVYSPKYVQQMGNGYPQFNLNGEAGLMTWRFAYLYTEHLSTDSSPDFADYDAFTFYLDRYGMVDMWIQLEVLPFTLWNALSVADYEIRYIDIEELCQQRTNCSDHRPCEEYHTDRTRELIGEKEKYIVERFRY